MTKPIFNGTKIASVDSLAAMLGLTKERLEKVILSIPKSYKTFTIHTGKNRKTRILSEPKKHLKYLQKRINKEIFEKVTYPDYLHGGIKERDYLSNASVHTGKKTLISLDISDFYPSISKKDVRGIFKYLMRFSDDVSDTLTELVTIDGEVPQGACCSSYIANLLFHNCEHDIVRDLRGKGFTYTRLLDDITISSEEKIDEKLKTNIINKVSGLIKRHRLDINDKKTKIEHADNPKSEMHVTGLWVKHKKPKLDKENRRYIRYLVFICVKQAEYDRVSAEYHELWNRASGKVAQLARIGHKQSKELRDDLSKILPLYDDYKIKKITMLARNYMINFTIPVSDEQKKKINRLIYDLDIVARTNHAKATPLKKELKKMIPSEGVI